MKKALLPVAAFAALILLSVAAVGQSTRVAATTRSQWVRFNPVTPLTASSFAHPPAADQPWVRMNMPATADPAEIAREVRELHDAGIAGVEIACGQNIHVRGLSL
jgi:hypothetical protein